MKNSSFIVGAALLGTAFVMSASPALAKSYKVYPGESIQAAVDAASDGDTINVYPGTYTDDNVNAGDAAVYITKSIKLNGKAKKGQPVIIVPGVGQLHGILAEGTDSTHIDGVSIKGFTVQGFPKNGIWLRYVDNFKIEKNTSIDNLENGIWPTLSASGRVKKNVSYGSDDSALWVEASSDVRVQQNEIYDSVTGLEVTISANIKMDKNNIHDNTVGVGVYHPNGAGMVSPPELLLSPGLVFSKNTIVNNNRANSAPPSSLSGSLPPGGGMLVLGVDGVYAEKNTITGNDFFGIALVDYCAAVDGGSNSCGSNPAIVQGMPELNTFANNELSDNGTNPGPHALADYAADFTYILTDIFTPGPSAGPYVSNKVCGTKPPLVVVPLDQATIKGLGSGQITVAGKC